jgi:hypothetical protein
MSILEEKIRKNKDLFDKAEPPKGHSDRFASKLKDLHKEEVKIKPRRSSRVYKIAAVLAILLGISAVLIFTIPQRSVTGVAASELPEELKEAKFYYEEQANKKLEQINQCAATNEEAAMIRDMAVKEMEALDETSTDLEGELQVNSENQRVKDALIMNYKTKSEILDNILNMLCNI